WWPVQQWAAVVTIDGCTSVPVHPLSRTVVGNWHSLASCPPVMASRMGSAGAGSDGAQPEEPATTTRDRTPVRIAFCIAQLLAGRGWGGRRARIPADREVLAAAADAVRTAGRGRMADANTP